MVLVNSLRILLNNLNYAKKYNFWLTVGYANSYLTQVSISFSENPENMFNSAFIFLKHFQNYKDKQRGKV